MAAVAKPQPLQPQLEPCLTLESSGHCAMALEGFSLIFIVCWQQISLPAHPSRSSSHLPSLSINLIVHLPPGLLLRLAKFPILRVWRHVVQWARKGGRDANPSRSPSGIQVSAERASPLEGQRNISSPAISRKTDGSTGRGGGEGRGGSLGLGGEGSGGGEKSLLPTVVWEGAVVVLVVCSAGGREVCAASGAGLSQAIPRRPALNYPPPVPKSK